MPDALIREVQQAQAMRDAVAALSGPLPSDGADAVLRDAAASVQGRRVPAWRRDRLDRLPARSLSRPPAVGSRGDRPVPVAVAPPSVKRTPVRDKAQAQSLIEQSRELLRVDFHRALTCAHEAAAIAEEIGDVHLHALSTRAVANALSVGGNNQASIEHHVTGHRRIRADRATTRSSPVRSAPRFSRSPARPL